MAAGAAVSLLAVLVPYWTWWQLHDDEPFVLPVPVGAAERVTWSLPGKHDLLFSLTGGQLGGNVRLLLHHVAAPPLDGHALAIDVGSLGGRLETVARAQGKGLSAFVRELAGGAQSKEPSRLRPAVVIEDQELFPDDNPNMLVVPVTRDAGLAHQSFAERIEPTEDNAVETTCWALAHHVTSVSRRRISSTVSQVTASQLESIRRRITVAIG